MNQDMENIKEQLEEVIKKNLPPNDNRKILSFGIGFNQALSQINTSLIADEVLKVVENSKLKTDEIYPINGNNWREELKQDFPTSVVPAPLTKKDLLDVYVTYSYKELDKFISKLLASQIKNTIDIGNKLKINAPKLLELSKSKKMCHDKMIGYADGYNKAINELLSNLSPNKENKNNENSNSI